MTKKLFAKRYHPPGTSPGTLALLPPRVPFTLQLVDYTDTDYLEKELATPGEVRVYLERPSTTWVHVQGSAPPEVLQGIGHLFGLHRLALEDVVNHGQRAKVDEYGHQLFLVAYLPVPTGNGVMAEQVSLFVGENFVVSLIDGNVDPFAPVRKRLREHIGRIRSRGSDYLLYALLDVIVDEGFPVLEILGERIEALEEELLDMPGRNTLKRIHQIRRELLTLRRRLWPQRDVLSQIAREECPCIEEGTRLYLRDCYDHTVQVVDLIETYRDMVANLMEVYLSNVSYRLNEIMRMLTVIATVFIPLTFLAGVYGMNFSVNTVSPWAMPELHWDYGYPLFWLVTIGLGGGMLYYFKRRKWL